MLLVRHCSRGERAILPHSHVGSLSIVHRDWRVCAGEEMEIITRSCENSGADVHWSMNRSTFFFVLPPVLAVTQFLKVVAGDSGADVNWLMDMPTSIGIISHSWASNNSTRLCGARTVPPTLFGRCTGLAMIKIVQYRQGCTSRYALGNGRTSRRQLVWPERTTHLVSDFACLREVSAPDGLHD